jgi:Ca-activated chloride channel family protein
MNFAWPLVLIALAALPVLGGLYWLMQRRRNQYAVRFTNLDLLASVVDRSPNWKRHVPPVLYSLAIGALVVALARPQTEQRIPKDEATVILVTDVSGSMNAEDVAPTRLVAAKKSAQDLVDRLPPKIEVAVIAFSNSVRTVVAPTTDREAIARGIQSLRSNGGTAMGDALQAALDLASPLDPPATPAPGSGGSATPTATPAPRTVPGEKKAPPAIIVLLSDGKNSVGSEPIDAANEALARGIPIFTVALGTPDGVVDIVSPNGAIRRVQVPPDEETLAEIAALTDGKSFKAESAGDLANVYKQLGNKIGYEIEDADITHWWAAGALAVMVAGAALSLLWFNRFP